MNANVSSVPVALRPILLRCALLLGSALDGLVALALLLAPEHLLPRLAFAVPEESWLLGLLAILLGTFALFQLPPAYDIVAYSGNIACTLLARIVLGLFFLWASIQFPESRGLNLAGAVQIALTAVYAVCWLSDRRGPLL